MVCLLYLYFKQLSRNVLFDGNNSHQHHTFVVHSAALNTLDTVVIVKDQSSHNIIMHKITNL